MIVVLGAFGKTGRVVARLARNQERETLRLVTRDAGRRPEAGSELAVARLSVASEVEQALRGARALFAMLPDDLGSQAFHAERRAMADAIAGAVRREAIPRVVLLSSSAAALGERGGNGLAADLAYFERVMTATDAAVTVVRACYFQDNLLEARQLAERDGVYPNFLPTRSAIATIASADVGSLAARELFTRPKRDREIVDLLGPTYSAEQLAHALGEALGRKLLVSEVPSDAQESLFRQWMSPEAARAMRETFACLGAGRVPLEGDRLERGTMRVGEMLSRAIGPSLPYPAPEVA